MHDIASVQFAANGIGGDEVPDPIASKIYGVIAEIADHVGKFGLTGRPGLVHRFRTAFFPIRQGQQARHARHSPERRNPLGAVRFEDVPARCDQPDCTAANREGIGVHLRWSAR